MRGVIDLGQVLKVQPRINLRGADIGVSQQLLHGTQVATALQQMTGKGMAQHVRMHRNRQPCLTGTDAQLLPDGLRSQARAVSSRQQRGRALQCRHRGTQLQPLPGTLHGHPRQRNAAALAPLAQHMRQSVIQIEPADRLRRWLHIQPDQFTHTQAAAVEQLHHQLVAHFYPRRFVHTATIAQRLGGRTEIGQLYGGIHWQGLGQGLGRLGSAHTVERVVLHALCMHQPAEQAAPP